MASQLVHKILISLIFIEISITMATAQEKNGLLKKICYLKFNTEMKVNGEPPKRELANFTCNCFIRKLKLGESINSAQSECKQEVSTKFNL